MKRTLTILAVLVAGFPLCAQNLNPEVHVTNDYSAHMGDAVKNGVEMAAPDSLFKFDYKFNYSVFESPYKGSYEFSPYSIQVTPAVEERVPARLYLRAGAGFTLHPELDVTYAPVSREDLQISIFNSARGYYGPYRQMDTYLRADNTASAVNGYDFKETLGAEGRLSRKDFILDFKAGYDGIAAGADYGLVTYFLRSSMYNSAYAGARMRSTGDSKGFFMYDVSLDYRFGMDRLYDNALDVNEHIVNLAASLEPAIMTDYVFRVDFGIDADKCSGALDAFLARFYATPHFDFELGPVSLSLGAMMSAADKLHVYPAVNMSWPAINDWLTLFAGVNGGEKFNGYHSFKTANHHFHAECVDAPAISREVVDASAGVRGHLANSLQYSVKGGYSVRRNDVLYMGNYLIKEQIGYADYNLAHFDAQLDWASDRFNADFAANLGFMDFKGGWAAERQFFKLPMLTAKARGVYNWNDRFFLGANAEFSSSSVSRPGDTELVLPWFVDLGVEADYRFNSKWAVWLKGGNLLNQDVRRSPLYSQKGIVLTAGIALSL